MHHTVSSSGGGWGARCSYCGRLTAASPTSASTSASSAWVPSAGRSGRSSVRRLRTTASVMDQSWRPTASGWRPRGRSPRRGWRCDRAVLEKPTRRRLPSLSVVHIKPQRRDQAMITKLNVTSVKVLDQDQALDFYVNKLGLEKGSDIQQGAFRWLTVRVPGDVTEIFLEEPGPPLHDEATAAQLRELITKGAMSSLVFNTDDVRGLYETLQARGVTDFTQEPITHGYGTDMGVRDPFGNAIRILQQGKVPQKVTA